MSAVSEKLRYFLEKRAVGAPPTKTFVWIDDLCLTFEVQRVVAMKGLEMVLTKKGDPKIVDQTRLVLERKVDEVVGVDGVVSDVMELVGETTVRPHPADLPSRKAARTYAVQKMGRKLKAQGELYTYRKLMKGWFERMVKAAEMRKGVRKMAMQLYKEWATAQAIQRRTVSKAVEEVLVNVEEGNAT